MRAASGLILSLQVCRGVRPRIWMRHLSKIAEVKNESVFEKSAAAIAAEAGAIRTNWTKEEIKAIYDSPLMDLVHYGVCLQANFLSLLLWSPNRP